MNRRKFLFLLGGVSVLPIPATMVAKGADWIQKRRRVDIRGLRPGGFTRIVVAFSAGPGDYAEVTSELDVYGLVESSEINANGDVVITIYNPGTQAVSVTTMVTVRLYKM